MDNSKITRDEIINEEETSFNEKNVTCKTQNSYILLVVLSINVELLIAVSTYYYLIKHIAKRKHLLPFHDKKIEQVYINNIK